MQFSQTLLYAENVDTFSLTGKYNIKLEIKKRQKNNNTYSG